MALTRLRRVLQSHYTVRLRSDQRLLNRVNGQIARRAQKCVAKGQTPPVTKRVPSFVASVQARPQWTIRAISLLHKIGTLTTPAWVNLAQLSASWATRRYFWAIADGNGGQQDFRLSEDARRLDFHQKTLLSDEMGVGFAGLLAEEILNASSFADVSKALDDPTVHQDVQQVGTAQPDYLMWGEDAQSPYYVVECKGCQTNSSTSMDQIRRGLEQVPSLVFGIGARSIVPLVIATHLEQERTTIFVLDPPNDAHDRGPTGDSGEERVSKRIGERTWEVTNVPEFERRTRLSKESELLKWAGQFSKALERDKSLAPLETVPALPDLELETRKTRVAAYKGHSSLLFPELGYRSLRVFTGVEEELLAKIVEDSPDAIKNAKAIQEQLAGQAVDQESPYVSQSRNGTCMIVEGVE